jgi:glycosyltransferase involved in cell wall biosynthesis
MKKKIVFMVINMNIGGTEKALLNMINEMPKDQYEITILMLEKYGGFLDAIPKEVRVEYLEDYAAYKQLLNRPVKTSAVEFIKQGKIVKGIALGCVHTLSKIFQNKMLYYNYVLKDLLVYKKNYDVAVAYAGPMDFISYFITQKIKAKKKVQWIHFDVGKIGFDWKSASKIYDEFDKTFVVSQEGKRNLSKVFKKLHRENKIDYFGNIISSSLIKRLADEDRGFTDDYDGLRILTVGRLSKEKGQDVTIKVLSRLRQEGYKVRWYCVGEGKSRKEYERLIKEYKVKGDYLLLGAKINPYPFMKDCNLYVQPSRHEGYCITLAEARCFNNPIITTDFTGAREQIKHNENGVIVGFSEEELYKAVVKIISDKQFKNKIINNLESESVDTKGEMRKLYEIINY